VQDALTYYSEYMQTPHKSTKLPVAQWFEDKQQELPPNLHFVPFDKKTKMAVKRLIVE
jgi:hypothetical protein